MAFRNPSRNGAVMTQLDENPVVKLKATSLQERVYEALRDAIRSGRFRSGETVTLRGLAEMLGTSQMPVREAVRRLIQERSIESLSNRTMRIPILSAKRFDELTDVRVTLEGRAAALAALRMTPSEFTQIKLATERMSRATDSGDLEVLLAANEAVHFGVYRAAGSELLFSMIETLWQQSGPYIATLSGTLVASPSNLIQDGLVHHFELLAALGSRNPEAAQKAMSADIEDAARWYRMHITTISNISDYGASSDHSERTDLNEENVHD